MPRDSAPNHDRDDGLPVSDVGEWALRKHALLSRYLEISAATRRKYRHRGYLDLLAGPGRSRVRESGMLIDGSPLVACQVARATRSDFTAIHVAESDADYRSALATRLTANGFKATVHEKPAEAAAEDAVAGLDKWGLHFAFIDPFNLAALPFSMIETLAKVKRMDMLIHVSAMHLKREFWTLVDPGNSTLERFAPGWQTKVDTRQRQDVVRREIFDHWLSLIHGLRFGADREGVVPVVNGRNSELYWLVLISRHELAAKFWDAARDIDAQGQLL